MDFKLVAARVLFIDFDGVMHAASGPGPSMRWFVWAPMLGSILSVHPDVDLVIHASARDHQSLKWMQARAGSLGERIVDAVEGRIGRWEAIQRYLTVHPEILDYKILDDAADEFPIGFPGLILCDSATGISEPSVQTQIRQWLACDRSGGS